MTLLLHLVAGGVFFFGWQQHIARKQPTSMAVVNIAPPASPPVPQVEIRQEAIDPAEKSEPTPPVARPSEVIAVKPLVPISIGESRPAAEAPQPRPPEPREAQVRSIVAPAAPTAASEAPDSWEGRVLATLNKVKRYPATARARREQGVAWIRFAIDRDGKLVTARLEQSSGSGGLDREALALPRRAQPLPKPPASRPGEIIELVVPVEFVLPR